MKSIHKLRRHRLCRGLRRVSVMVGVFLALISDTQAGGVGSKKTLGLGVMLGEPSGLSLKYWSSSVNAVQFGLAYSFGDYVAVLGDYLWHFPRALSSATHGSISQEFVPYIGIGGVVFIDNSGSLRSGSRHFFQDSSRSNSVAAGVRIPLGIEFLPHALPLGIALELVPGLGVIPGIFGFIQGDIAFRFYF